MASLYAKFIKEIMDWDTIEDEDSFVTYELQKIKHLTSLKIIEMYVDPRSRGNKKWKEMADKVENIARELNCNKMSAHISKSTNGNIQKRTAHLCSLFGMKKTYEDIYCIIYSKDVNHG